jgi:7-cyano-7-deazaguanine synthase in queuosine biosynthesis
MSVAPGSGTVLLMLSGGVDSAYLLQDYLARTEDRMHAHHVSLRYPHQQRWRVEDRACRAIVAWCRRHLRDFEYSTSRFDLRFRGIGWDSDLFLLVASKVALNLGPGPVQVALGWCVDDLERPIVRDRVERGVTTRIWRALHESIAAPHVAVDLAFPLVERGLTKAELVDGLPQELLELTWSCRQPDFSAQPPRPCGSCHSCRLREKAEGWIVPEGAPLE